MMISRVRAGSARSHTPGATRLRPYPSDSLAVTLKDTYLLLKNPRGAMGLVFPVLHGTLI
jgi:hypothetical protein